jgi:preprotein translocase subunit SecB
MMDSGKRKGMNMPVLELIEYIFPEIECRANPKCPRNPDEIVAPKVRVSNKMAIKENDENIFRLSLEISFGDKDQLCSYMGRVKAVGIFTAPPDLDEKEKHVYINGSSILYSAAREFILSITSRGPNIPLMLPTIRFHVRGNDRAVSDGDDEINE